MGALCNSLLFSFLFFVEVITLDVTCDCLCLLNFLVIVVCYCYWLLLITILDLVYMNNVGSFCSFGFVKERRLVLVFVVVVLGSISGVLEGWSSCGGRLLLFCVCICRCYWLLLRMIVEDFWHIWKMRDFFWSFGFVFLWFL